MLNKMKNLWNNWKGEILAGFGFLCIIAVYIHYILWTQYWLY